ncbi:MAG: acetyltransferase [Firmicutes bacterium]|nr:acetyltransferase [Bacillota bacterium]
MSNADNRSFGNQVFRRGPQLLIVGAGGHAKVIADAALAAGFKVVGFVDDAQQSAPLPGMRVLGTVADVPQLLQRAPGTQIVIAIGDNAARRRVAQEIIGQLGGQPSALRAREASEAREARIQARAPHPQLRNLTSDPQGSCPNEPTSPEAPGPLSSPATLHAGSLAGACVHPCVGPSTSASAGTRVGTSVGSPDSPSAATSVGSFSRLPTGSRFAIVIHPAATVSPYASIGPGTVVLAGAVVNPGTHVGEHVILNTACSVDHDCSIGPYAHLSPGVHLAGGVVVEAGAHLGVGVSVIPRRRIGAWSVVGAGAAVVDDIPPGVVAYGVPARVVRNSQDGSE